MFNKSFIKNLTSLYGIQIAALILPLITLPYLARSLKPEALGELSSVQSLAVTLSLFIEYGFVFSATREIALNKDSPNVLSEIVSQVLSAKIFITFLLFILYIFGRILFHNKITNPLMITFGFIYAIIQGFSPLWYFQGIEKLPKAVTIEVTGRCLALIAIFIFIHSPKQAWLVLAIQAFFMLVSLAINYRSLYSKVIFIYPTFYQAQKALKQGWSMFLFRASVMLYTTANTAILRLFIPAVDVVQYANADKIVNAAKSGIQPITQIVFPRVSNLISYDKVSAIETVRKTFIVLMTFSLIVSIIIWVIAPYFIPWYLGRGYNNSVQLLQLLSISIPVIALSNVLGIHWMLPNKMDKAFNIFILSAGIFNIILLFYLVPKYGSRGMVYSILISETYVDISMITYLVRKKDFPLYISRRRRKYEI